MNVDREALAVGRSLWPLIRGGRRLQPARRPPKAGDVVVYRAGAAVRAHRVLALSEHSLLVRGDHPAVPLERISRAQVVGVWAPDDPWLKLVLGGATGRLVGLLGLAAGRAGLVSAARFAAARVPLRAGGVPAVSVASGSAELLAVALGHLGLQRPLASVDEVASRLLRDTGFVVIAQSDGRTVGALRVLAVEDGLLVAVSLERRYRGRGLGTRLLEAAVAEARRRGAGRLLADIRRDNVASLRLFQGAGFTRVAEAVLVAPGDGVLFDRYALELG